MSDSSLSHLMATRRWCYTIPICQDTEATGGYVPSVAIEDESGHFPMSGSDGGAPWIWGKTLHDAESICAEANAKLGLDRDTCLRIVASTFKRASSQAAKHLCDI